MTGSNLPTEKPQRPLETNVYFNNFGNELLRVSPEVDESVISFFEKITGEKKAARNLAGAVLFTAKNQGLKVSEVIDEFRKKSPGEINAFLAMFLNLDRVPTSLVAIGNTPQTSRYVTRAILP